jgi:wobble nucleotide-excising tRNase
MLKRIESIKDFGVFSDWKADADLPDFAQYNLIYGANGSGKSTLGRLLDRLGGREFDPEHAQAQFAVVKEGGSRLTRDNPRVACPVHVFNKDFEKRNIDWDKRVESILLVSEERIADREELERLRAQHEGAFEELAATEGERDRIGRAVKKFWSDRASDMKKIFGALGTEEDRFLRYDAPKLERLFETAGRELTGGAAMLLSETLDRTRKAARAGEPKPSLAAPAYCLDPQEVDALARRVEDLLATSAAAKVVERLRERPEIARWVEDGLAFHEHVATTVRVLYEPAAGRLASTSCRRTSAQPSTSSSRRSSRPARGSRTSAQRSPRAPRIGRAVPRVSRPTT